MNMNQQMWLVKNKYPQLPMKRLMLKSLFIQGLGKRMTELGSTWLGLTQIRLLLKRNMLSS